jgi:hypothetical protein
MVLVAIFIITFSIQDRQMGKICQLLNVRKPLSSLDDDLGLISLFLSGNKIFDVMVDVERGHEERKRLMLVLW